MAVIWSADDMSACMAELDDECFYCGGKLAQYPVIYWTAGGEDIKLHPACTLDLNVRLMRDVHETQCGPHMSPARAVRGLRRKDTRRVPKVSEVRFMHSPVKG